MRHTCCYHWNDGRETCCECDRSLTLGELVAPCGCNWDVEGQSLVPAVVCEKHVGADDPFDGYVLDLHRVPDGVTS